MSLLNKGKMMIFSFYKVFLSFFLFSLSFTSKADILEKYLKADNKKPINSITVIPKDKSSYYPDKETRSLKQRLFGDNKKAKKPSPFLFSFNLGANREHLQSSIYFSKKTHKKSKFTPLVGMKIDYDDTRKYFSNFSFSIGLQYVIFKYYDIKMAASLEQELENYFSIPTNEQMYTFLTSRLHLELSYELTDNFAIFASFSPKYSFVSDRYLENAPRGVQREAKQIIDYNYGFSVKI